MITGKARVKQKKVRNLGNKFEILTTKNCFHINLFCAASRRINNRQWVLPSISPQNEIVGRINNL